MSNAPFILVDGSSYLFRAYHALPPLTNIDGHPTGAIYGVINMIRQLIQQYQPSHIAVVFDTKSKNFRHEMFPDYKANRPEMPEELACQIQPLHDIIKALGLPLVAVDGIEADDVIGTLAHQAAAGGHQVLISTGDKDMAQLVNDRITLINTMTNKTFDRKAVIEKFGVPPERMIDYLALMGDTVDNVPGVEKVGPKTACKWLALYDSLDGVVAHADDIKGKVGENLRAALERLPLSKALVTIRLDMDLPVDIADLKRAPADNQALRDYFQRFEFKKWLSEVSPGESGDVEKNDDVYECVLTRAQLETWLQKLQAADCFAFDTETSSLNAMQAEIIGVSFCCEDGVAAYVPLAHDYLGAPEQLSRSQVLAALTPLLQDQRKTIIGQNLKYDLKVLANYQIDVKATLADTMLQSYVLNSTERHDMDSLAKKYLQRETIHYEDVAGKGAKQILFSQVAIEKATQYAAEDADITWQLYHFFKARLAKDIALEKVYQTLELPLMPILMEMERTGVLVDALLLAKQSKTLEVSMQQLSDKIFEASGEVFNIASTKQLGEVLYEKLQLPVLKKTPKGQPSTAENVLQELAFDYELPKWILQYRSLAKLKSTYTDALPKEINPTTKRVHTSYRQAVTSTGRLSSSDPNLQNIPIKTAEGRQVREAFVAAEGCQLISADYSQVELRIMAHLSQDKNLLYAFNQGLDVHRATAAEVLGKSVEAVTTEERRSAKAVNFGLIYGMSAFGLAQQLNISRQEAQQYIDIYFERYPGVKAYMDRTREQAIEQGYVETVFGRKLFLPAIQSNNAMQRKAAERAAINAPMQGTAADIIKQAMIHLHQALQSYPGVKLIMQVHDELIVEAPMALVEKVQQLMIEVMQNAADLSVPLLVEANHGHSWEAAH